jgi:peptidoglycan/xylan/chitin deacetylase (PgdA/CDA1 family)
MVILKSILQRLYPLGICRVGEAVYLTFDDGPIPEVTPKVLKILDEYNVKATFFMVGENIDKHPDIFAQVVKAGHTIGNHTYNHMKGWRVSTAEYLDNVHKWEEAVERNLTAKRSNSDNGLTGVAGLTAKRSFFRPPYGRTWWWQRKAVRRLGYTIVLWDVLTRDYNPCRTPDAMLRQIQRQTRPGSIINFHDSVKSNERMLEVLPEAIKWLQAQGYELKAL